MPRLNAIQRSVAVIALGLLIGAVSCSSIDELLEAQNPANIDESQLNDAALIAVLTNSVTGALQDGYADPLIWRSSMLTDEVVQGINWEGTARTSQRIVRYDDEGPDPVFTALSRYRFMADSVVGRFRTLIPDPHKNR